MTTCDGTGSKVSTMSGCPAQRKESEVTTNSCPVQHDKRQQKETEGNVESRTPGAGDDVNPYNLIPRLSQEPAPGQPYPLSTAREHSTIPKAGSKEGETWTYPSEQMFFNAMLGKARAGWRAQSGLQD
jgi:cytochrome c heme-lyase